MAAIDLWSKLLWDYPQQGGAPLHQKTIIENWLDIRTVWNEGGVWSMPIPKWILLVASVSAAPLIGLWLMWPAKSSRWENAAKALVLGGAIGNLWDRVRSDAVRDFIDVCFGDPAGYHYPTFNVADIALVAGIVMLLISSWRPGGRREETAA